jgi:hypothetical protein
MFVEPSKAGAEDELAVDATVAHCPCCGCNTEKVIHVKDADGSTSWNISGGAAREFVYSQTWDLAYRIGLLFDRGGLVPDLRVKLLDGGIVADLTLFH